MNPVQLLCNLGGNGLLLAAGICGLGFLIGFHELGHFLMCKLFGISAPSFSIGFGPRIWTKKIGETDFSLSAIPLGGYVEVAGLGEVGQGAQEHAQARGGTSFADKPYYQKLLVMLGGIGFNLLFAYLAFIALSWHGIPETYALYPLNATTELATVEDNSSAAQAGLMVGDTITTIDGTPVKDVPQALKVIASHPDQQVNIDILRNGESRNIPATLGSREAGNTRVGVLGVMFSVKKQAGLPFLQAIGKGISLTHHVMTQMVRSISRIFTHRETAGVGGPIAIIAGTMQSACKGWSIFLIALALISINLALLNLLPLPILDGGQVLFFTIETLIRRPLSPRIREYIHIATWVLMLGLMLLLSIKDVLRIAQPYISKIWK